MAPAASGASSEAQAATSGLVGIGKSRAAIEIAISEAATAIEKATPEAAAAAATSSRSGLARKRIPCTSGSNWTEEQLQFFNIHVVREAGFEAFFKEKPREQFNQEVAEFLDLNLEVVRPKTKGVVSSQVKHVAKDLIAVTKSHRNDESAVDDMSKSLLQLFDYDSGERSVRTRCTLQLEMSNRKTEATPDVCVEDEDSSIRLLVGKVRNLKGHHPVPQLIADAIAAYQENVDLCERLVLPAYPGEKVIPGIVMLGTRPAFYLIHMTKALSDCVKQGEKPEFVTMVQEYVPPNLPVTISDAMLDKRFWAALPISKITQLRLKIVMATRLASRTMVRVVAGPFKLHASLSVTLCGFSVAICPRLDHATNSTVAAWDIIEQVEHFLNLKLGLLCDLGVRV
ncbi:hypothetical protein SELMODRAFT_403783 [Selaginella moellendorffii]|uniref:Uncharacterized protein n=1 Tax=Selaginella moellendorffii TaxID=88036 RepID=D8QSI7_SELML|nr:hypothetical protein SELMODRAFT_403783 [Selaginella moellendorffii]